MKYQWTIAIVAMAVLVAAPRHAPASCGQAQCSVDPGLTAAPLSARAVRLDLSTEYIEQDEPWVRHHSTRVGAILRDDHNEVETTNLTWKLRAEAAISDRWAIGFLVPFLHREHFHLASASHSHGAQKSAFHARHADHGEQHDDPEHDDGNEITIGNATGIPARWNFTRLGDLQLTAAYAVALANDPDDWLIRLYAGLKLPSGSTKVRNNAGEEAEITLQPGTGSVEPIFGATVQRRFSLGETTARWPFSAGVQVRTEGSSGRFGYRPGTEVITSVATEYPVTPRLHALAQMNFRYRDRDHVGHAPGVPAEHTGNEALYLSPGVRLDLSAAAGVYSYVQVPVYQRVNGIQLVSQWNLLAGLIYSFDI